MSDPIASAAALPVYRTTARFSRVASIEDVRALVITPASATHCRQRAVFTAATT
ncbi:hypothetical protein [Nocardia sp. CA-120079]|uniref:hypothetical protein n=1 Tax=Nocardia sp. CA-120079 TaxID=3239974 RepID=UPI003D977616